MKRILAIVLAMASVLALAPVSQGMAASEWKYSDDSSMGILVHEPDENQTLLNGQGFSYQFELKNNKTIDGEKKVFYDFALYGLNAGGNLDAQKRVKELKLQNPNTEGSKHTYNVNISGVAAGDYYLVMMVWNENEKNAEGRDAPKAASIAYDIRKVKVAESDAAWVKYPKGWCYKKNGQWVTGKWELINGKWYLFDAEGYMLANWQQNDGKWYYLGSDGAMRVGWQLIGGKWYCFQNNGIMYANVWLKDDGEWYMLGATGAMLTGWQQDRNTWYYMTPATGAMHVGWLKLGNSWYYTNANGKMVTGTVSIGSEKHSFNSSGVWTGQV